MTNKWDGEATSFGGGGPLTAADLNDTFTAVANATIVGVYTDTDSTDNSTNSTSYVDTNLSIIQTTGTNKCLVFVSFHDRDSANYTNGVGHHYRLLVDSTVIAEVYHYQEPFTIVMSVPLVLVGITDTLTAASHTFKVQFYTSNGASNMIMAGSTGATSKLTVIELKV